MSTTNGMWLYDQLDPLQNCLQIYEYQMEFWWEPEAKLDCVRSDRLSTLKYLERSKFLGTVSTEEWKNSTHQE